jgi:hypothetical protein
VVADFAHPIRETEFDPNSSGVSCEFQAKGAHAVRTVH